MAPYFAYGSNLLPSRLRERCPSARAVGAAAWPGHRLEFAGSSAAWAGGGVATAREVAGAALPGALFELSDADLAALDRFEGEGRTYFRIAATVDATGGPVPAEVYVRDDDEPLAPPTTAYVDAIDEGCRRWEIDPSGWCDAVSRARPPEPPPGRSRVFVYGTLKRREANARLLTDARFLGTASTVPSFRLLDLGAFPALVEGGSVAVHGELYDIDADGLRRLDLLEGHPDFYRRTNLALADGSRAQAYLLLAPRDGTPEVEGGTWTGRGRRGGRAIPR